MRLAQAPILKSAKRERSRASLGGGANPSAPTLRPHGRMAKSPGFHPGDTRIDTGWGHQLSTHEKVRHHRMFESCFTLTLISGVVCAQRKRTCSSVVEQLPVARKGERGWSEVQVLLGALCHRGVIW